jgi:diguanylate cyclase (GGDEF)-like protein
MSLASLLNDPKHWQDRAAQAESLADQISDVVGKATALSIAEDYARLGRRAEKRPLVRLDGAETGDRASNPAAAAQPADQAVRAARLRLSGRSIMPITYLVVAAIVGIVAYLIAWSYQEAGGKARHTAENLARTLEGDIARNVELYDSALQRLSDVLANPAVAGLAPDLRNLLLFSLAGRSADLGPIRIFDAQGNLSADSESVKPRDENVAWRDDFRLQREERGTGLTISAPFKDRLAYGADSIALSRRLTDRDGAFAGVASAVLRLAYFRSLFQQVDVGPHSVITFASTDGTILVRQPSLTAAGDVGLRLINVPNFWRMVNEKTGVFTASYPVDGVKRMRAFRRIGGLPLIIVVGLALDDIYAEWWRRAAWSIAVTGAVCVGIILLAWGFRRELRRRELAEQDLAELATALSGMAVTDPLTGLGNRRHFDTLLQREWRRAARSKSWLSLLMIDIDHFKAFNDHHGHQQGDEVLRILAKAISGSTRRPGDSGARYGGEEFAVVLPDTDLRGAMAVAENIRAAFINREEAGELAAALPTISIGVSSVRPAGNGETTLVRSADQALYAAKEGGRNRTEIIAINGGREAGCG